VLEDCLNDIVVGIVYVADAIASRRRDDEDREIRARDEQIREYERYRQRAAEAEKVKGLEELAARWHTSQRLRTYLAAVRTVMAGDASATQSLQLVEWLAWAEAYVSRLDPLAQGIELPRATSW